MVRDSDNSQVKNRGYKSQKLDKDVMGMMIRYTSFLMKLKMSSSPKVSLDLPSVELALNSGFPFRILSRSFGESRTEKAWVRG